MGNTIKYSTGSESLALKKGNFYIGTGDVPKGPTSLTGFYNSYNPPENGWTMYFNKAVGGPATYAASNVTELIFLTNHLCGTNFSTSGECLNYFATQTDKVIFNRNYEPIVTNGLVLNLDAGFVPSYQRSGTTWYDISLSGNNGTLINGPTFNSNNGGSIVFDGTNDYSEVTSRNTNLEFQPTSGYSCMVFYKSPSPNFDGALIANMVNSFPYSGWDIYFNNPSISNTIAMHLISSWSSNAIKIAVNYNYSTYANQWLSFGYTYDGSCPTTEAGSLNSVDFYLNGALYTSGKQLGQPGGVGKGFSTSTTTITYNSSQRFRVASRWLLSNVSGPSSPTVGVVLLYNKKLTAAEMLQNYNALKGRYGL